MHINQTKGETNMNRYTLSTIIAVGILAVVSLCIYMTKDPDTIIGLFFLIIPLFISRAQKFSTECPKCKHEFTAVED